MAAGFVLGFQKGFISVWRWKKAETELSSFNFKPSTSYQQTFIQVHYLKLVCSNSRTSIELSGFWVGSTETMARACMLVCVCVAQRTTSFHLPGSGNQTHMVSLEARVFTHSDLTDILFFETSIHIADLQLHYLAQDYSELQILLLHLSSYKITAPMAQVLSVSFSVLVPLAYACYLDNTAVAG